MPVEGVQDVGRSRVLEQLHHAGERVGGAGGAEALQVEAVGATVAECVLFSETDA